VEQPDFINGVVAFETLLGPEELLEFLKELEKLAGREKTVRWGARTLDLDILLYEDVVTDGKELTIPHPDMHNRDFVLRPLAQLSPHIRHPLLQKTAGQLLAGLEERFWAGELEKDAEKDVEMDGH
jgi:dihydroneopterin aldolase/2-amino-4-hydroxy-6-hydroxymethyldihydropteridine diphosphokinase